MADGTRWVGLDAARVAALAALDVRDQGDRAGRSPIVMGLDQHRAQITAEWIDLVTGEISRARVAPADRVAVRRFLGSPVDLVVKAVAVGRRERVFRR